MVIVERLVYCCIGGKVRLVCCCCHAFGCLLLLVLDTLVPLVGGFGALSR